MADEPKFTPGPWATNCSHIYAPDGAIIATVSNPGSKAEDYPLVANRDLIAAAPDLLRAVENAIEAVRWTEQPEAAALLQSCADNPPAIVHHCDTYAITADHWTEYSRRDPRVRQLHRLWDEAFHAAEQAGEDTRPILETPPQKAIADIIRQAAHHRGQVQPKSRRAA